MPSLPPPDWCSRVRFPYSTQSSGFIKHMKPTSELKTLELRISRLVLKLLVLLNPKLFQQIFTIEKIQRFDSNNPKNFFFLLFTLHILFTFLWQKIYILFCVTLKIHTIKVENSFFKNAFFEILIKKYSFVILQFY